jgi:hypothetical protein
VIIYGCPEQNAAIGGKKQIRAYFLEMSLYRNSQLYVVQHKWERNTKGVVCYLSPRNNTDHRILTNA